MNPEGVTHAPLYLAKTLLLSAAGVMTLGRKIEFLTILSAVRCAAVR